ncbi:hypothetical protein ACFPDQ_06460 [Pseudofrancisella aestuarii]|uniref:Lipoprotein n=1 Tax=Pseudofrancisella aestuarii TaxID=2670347 RepID=A0ABV9TDC7_9GAMM|nr:hypothetical protein [Pseudofrancisella aestuarii]
MKNFTKIILSTLFITLLLSSCASRQKYIDQQESWIGKTITSYMIKFGYPNNILTINDEDKAYVYTKMMINPEAGRYGGPTETAIFIQAQKQPNFADMYSLNCTTWVIVDDKTNLIKNITFRGNYCVSTGK